MQDPKQDPDLDLNESKKVRSFRIHITGWYRNVAYPFRIYKKVNFSLLNLEDGGRRGGRGGDRRGQIRGAGWSSHSASATTGVLRHPPRLHVSYSG
jgi:hypothetical protein